MKKIYKKQLVFRTRNVLSKNILIGGANCFELNETALLIWNLIDGKKSVDEIVELICLEFLVLEEDVLSDTLHLIDELVKCDAIYCISG